MIKLIPDYRVLAALQLAFPKPANSAQHALSKYLTVLSQMIWRSKQRGLNPMQRKLGLISVSLSQLTKTGGQIGPTKIRLHKWLADNGMALVLPVITGNSVSRMPSQVRLTPLVTMHDTLATVVTGDTLSFCVAPDQDQQMVDANAQLFHYMYPQYQDSWTQADLLAVFDPVQVDMPSLRA